MRSGSRRSKRSRSAIGRSTSRLQARSSARPFPAADDSRPKGTSPSPWTPPANIHTVHSLKKSAAQIAQQFVRMRSLAAAPEEELLLTLPNVSSWCSAEHLDHLTKASSSIFRRLSVADGVPPSSGINLIGRVVLTVGWIPRGRGKSPERLYGSRANGAALLAAIDEAADLAQRLEPHTLERSSAPVVAHPKFGGLTPSEAMRFVAIHNEHHLRIIADITRLAKR